VNTSRLVELLSANLEPVVRRGFERALIVAIAAGGVAAFSTMLSTVGLRPHLTSPPQLEWSAIKLLFALSVVGTGIRVLVQSARPGGSTRALMVLIPFLVVDAAALATLLSTAPGMWKQMLLGAHTVSPARCLLCILVFGAIPWVALTHVLREGAPTRRGVCGALAGVVAGAVGAAAYAFACTSDSIAFIACWYVAAIALYAALGALLGSRIFRW
jgi:hypothetical protein